MLSLVFIPVYVQATAWSAGFGVTGWFRLSQVAAAMSSTTAIASVVWIQSMATAPVCYLLCDLGVKRSFDSNTRQSLLDFGPWPTLFYFLIPKLWPWIAASAIWTVAMTGNDMVVTNLFQVPTITETVYQQVQFNDLNPISVTLACSFAIAIGLIALALVGRLHSRLGKESGTAPLSTDFSAFQLQGTSRWLGAVLGWTVVSIVALIPLANLIVKAGWVATMENDQPQRGWSPMVLIHSISQTSMFTNEIGWSFQISLYASLVSLMLGVILLSCFKTKWPSWIAIGWMVCLLATPGPLVNLFVIWMFDHREPAWIGYLADRTLCGPILALQSRCLPIVYGILWLATDRYQRNNERLLQMDKGLSLSTRIWVQFLAIRTPLVAALVVSFFVAFADLSSYLLVQPPQVTTVAMRMFDLLHYGIKNRESGLALTLVIAGSLPTFLWMRRTTLI